MPLSAALYKQVDEQGNVTYTDVPTGENAKPIKPPPATTYKPLTTPSKPQATVNGKSEPSTEKSAVKYQSLQIAQPLDDQAVRANGGSFPVQLALTPDLDAEAHQIIIFVDNARHQETNTPSFELNNMDRGTHRIQAQIQDQAGNVLINSNTITVHVLRQSVTPQPRRPAN